MLSLDYCSHLLVRWSWLSLSYDLLGSWQREPPPFDPWIWCTWTSPYLRTSSKRLSHQTQNSRKNKASRSVSKTLWLFLSKLIFNRRDQPYFLSRILGRLQSTSFVLQKASDVYSQMKCPSWSGSIELRHAYFYRRFLLRSGSSLRRLYPKSTAWSIYLRSWSRMNWIRHRLWHFPQ